MWVSQVNRYEKRVSLHLANFKLWGPLRLISIAVDDYRYSKWFPSDLWKFSILCSLDALVALCNPLSYFSG